MKKFHRERERERERETEREKKEIKTRTRLSPFIKHTKNVGSKLSIFQRSSYCYSNETNFTGRDERILSSHSVIFIVIIIAFSVNQRSNTCDISGKILRSGADEPVSESYVNGLSTTVSRLWIALGSQRSQRPDRHNGQRATPSGK